MELLIVFIFILVSIIFYIVLSTLLSKKEKEKAEFFHFMAHRFRSPISVTRWYIELILDKSTGTLNDKQKEYFDEIYKASEKLNETIDSLLVLLQMQSHELPIKPQPTDMKSLINEITQKLKFKIDRHKLSLQVDFPTDKNLNAQIDPKLISIVLELLTENSINYSPENGNISIKTDIVSNKLTIEIKDNGYRIPIKNDSQLLASSVNAKDLEFSLSLVRNILKKVGAHTSFKTSKEKGTEFVISLPV